MFCQTVIALGCCCISQVALDQQSLAYRYQSIQSRHTQAIQLLSNRGSVEEHELRLLFELRNNDFRELIAAAESLPFESLAWDDLFAIASCCEAIQDYPRAYKYASRAAVLRPNEVQGHFSVVRALLNMGKVSEAESLVESLASDLPPESEFTFAYGLLYAHRNAAGDYQLASRHLRTMLDFYVDRIGESQGYGHGLGIYLKLFREVTEKANENSSFSETVDEWLALLNRRRAEISVVAKGAKRSDQQILDLAATCDALFQLGAYKSNEAAQNQFTLWQEHLTACVETRADLTLIAPELQLMVDRIRDFPLTTEFASLIKVGADDLFEKAAEVDPHFRSDSIIALRQIAALREVASAAQAGLCDDVEGK